MEVAVAAAEDGSSIAAPGGSCMALEACVEEGMVLMEEDVRKVNWIYSAFAFSCLAYRISHMFVRVSLG